MLRFLARRLLWTVAVLLLVATATFFLSRVVPANPAAFLAGQNASAETVARIAAEYGLDRPLGEQYLNYVAALGAGDLGVSMRTKQAVLADLGHYLPATLELLFVSFAIYIGLSFTLGLLAIRRPGGWLDRLIQVLAIASSGIPVFWLGMALQFVFFYQLGLLPLGGRFPIREIMPPSVTGFLLVDTLLAGDARAFVLALASLALPTATIVLNLLAVGTRLTRASLLRELERPYILTARGKGLKGSPILFKHVLRNALSPILGATAIQFGYMISWSVLVEVIFDWPGIGLYAYKSFQVFDYEPVIALALVSTVGFSLINLLVDLVTPLIDPRTRQAAT